MKHIAVINTYGTNNLGDQTIQTSCFALINEAVSVSTQLDIQCENPRLFANDSFSRLCYRAMYSPYGWAIRSQDRPAGYATKLFRLLYVYVCSIAYIVLGVLSPRLLPTRGFFAFLRSIRTAECVLGMGGGYFISKFSSDYFGLLLTFLPIYVAKLYRKKILFFPSSFGPFGNKYATQNGVAGSAKYDILFKREDFVEVFSGWKCCVHAGFGFDVAMEETNVSTRIVRRRLCTSVDGCQTTAGVRTGICAYH